ncbi:hypothetical protein NM208_g14333 [Fusarium decemcellulare]|uniref:Uncharacterized protein n=1 Tax=Fusarium decemcellulare TaxID=57161 RepID=A0ACC1RGE3_9HYPO|nr:hypothetical protein NM208_g14333 [Fusarium decemcellulare]
MDDITNDRSGDFLSVYSSSDDDKGPSLGPGWFSSQPASDGEPQGTSNAGSHELDSSAQTLKLTVIEQNAPRDYIRIAMAFPCPRTPYFEHQFQEIYDAVLRAFCRTVEHWPFLAGRFKVSDTAFDEKITLVYPKVVDKQSLTHLLTMVEPPSNGMPKAAREEMYTARLGIFKKERFSMKHHGPENHEPSPPVKITISLAGGMLVLGFSLSEVIFDALSIQNFFRKFLESTNQCIRGPEHQAVLGRVIPEAVNCDPDDKYELPCWDWKSTETEEPTLRQELRCRVFTLNAVLLQDLRRMVRERTMTSMIQTYPLIEDCVLGLFWVAIMRCRAEYKMIEPDDSVRANILVSGSQCLQGRGLDR